MKFALVLLLALAAAVCTNAALTSAPAPTYSAWSACDPTTCRQTRTITDCVPVDSAACNAFPGGRPTAAGIFGILTCQSCTDAGSCTSVPGGVAGTPWQGVYEVEAGHCQGSLPVASFGTATCCCMSGTVYVRQFDELVEITLGADVSLAGTGCFVTAQAAAAAGAAALANAPLSPKGVSFKTVDPAIPTNAGTYVPNSLFRDTATSATIADTNVPSTIRTAGTVSILGRSYRAIRTCDSIYIFGQAGFTSTDNPICPIKLNRVGDLADN